MVGKTEAGDQDIGLGLGKAVPVIVQDKRATGNGGVVQAPNGSSGVVNLEGTSLRSKDSAPTTVSSTKVLE